MEFLRNLRSNTKNTPHREPLYDSIVKKQENELKKQESNREIESLISNLELQIRKSQEQERISRAQREEAELKKKLERKKAHFYYLQYAEDKIKEDQKIFTDEWNEICQDIEDFLIDIKDICNLSDSNSEHFRSNLNQNKLEYYFNISLFKQTKSQIVLNNDNQELIDILIGINNIKSRIKSLDNDIVITISLSENLLHLCFEKPTDIFKIHSDKFIEYYNSAPSYVNSDGNLIMPDYNSFNRSLFDHYFDIQRLIRFGNNTVDGDFEFPFLHP